MLGAVLAEKNSGTSARVPGAAAAEPAASVDARAPAARVERRIVRSRVFMAFSSLGR